ncbi:MAG: hypothetical protein V3U87_15800 [Methylococcaceae bacterium]
MTNQQIFANIQNDAKEIFTNSFVLVEKVNDPQIRHIYLKYNITGEQIQELQKRYQILFVSQTYDEDNKRLSQKTVQVVLVTQKKMSDMQIIEYIRRIKTIQDKRVKLPDQTNPKLMDDNFKELLAFFYTSRFEKFILGLLEEKNNV